MQTEQFLPAVKKEDALKAFNQATEAGKKLLTGLWPKTVGKISDRVKDFDDILNIAGISESDFESGYLYETTDEFANRQAKLIAKVYNNGTELDPDNTDQPKYFPYFKITPGSGFGLSFGGVDDWGSLSFVGVRLCFARKEDAEDAGKKLLSVYASLLLK